MLKIRSLTARQLLAVSFLLGELANFTPAVAQAQEIVPSNPQQPVTSQSTQKQLNTLLEQANQLVKEGDFTDAIAVYQQATTLAPKDAELYSGIGYLQARQGNFSAAVTSYRQAVGLAPKNASFRYALGYSLANIGDNVGAANAYRQAIQLNRKDVNAYLGLGVVLFRQGKYTDAMQVNEKAVAIAPKFPRVYELKGAILKQQGHRQAAIAALAHARALYQKQGYQAGVDRAEAMLQALGQ